TITDRLSLFDSAIEHRLSKGRLVAFVVSETPITVHVDDHIALELVAKIEGEPNHLSHRFGIFAVDVKNRNLAHVCHIRGIGAGSRVGRRSGKTDLVVYDDVQGSADGVTF